MPIAVSGSNIVFADGSSIASGFTGFKNKIINGAMVIDQRNNGSSVTIASAQTYTLDRWRADTSLSNKYSVQRSTTAPTGFVSSLLVTSLAATSLGSGDYAGINQFVEGNNATDLSWGTANAKTVTLSFWVRSSLTGAFGGAIRTGDGSNYSYPFTYTINSANTWEQKSIVIPGPTAGTWQSGTGQGVDVWFSMGTGATYTGTAGAWAASNLINSTGSTNLVSTNGATWYLTGVQLEAGSTATSFEYRDYGNELRMCQRYYWKYINDYIVSGFNENSSGFLAAFTLPTQMRSAPTMGTDASATYRIRIPGATVTVTSLAGDSATVSSLRIVGGTSGGLTAGQGSILIANTNGKFIDFSSEL